MITIIKCFKAEGDDKFDRPRKTFLINGRLAHGELSRRETWFEQFNPDLDDFLTFLMLRKWAASSRMRLNLEVQSEQVHLNVEFLILRRGAPGPLRWALRGNYKRLDTSKRHPDVPSNYNFYFSVGNSRPEAKLKTEQLTQENSPFSMQNDQIVLK